LTAGAGVFSISNIYETDGASLGAGATAETVRDQWAKIADPTGAEAYVGGHGQTQKFLRKLAQ
jgi:hypothetical protein